MQWDRRLVGMRGAELTHGFGEGDLLGFGPGTDAVEGVAVGVADEGDGAAGARRIGAADTAACGELGDAAELLGVFGAESPQLHEQGQPLVALVVLREFFEEAESVDLFVGRVDLAVFAEGGVEGLELHDGLLAQLDVVVDAGGGVEVVDVDARGEGADAVDAADALHEARGVPRCVVIDDHIRAVEVHALGEHLGGDDDVEVVAAAAGVVGVEVGADVVAAGVAVAGVDGEHAVEAGK